MTDDMNHWAPPVVGQPTPAPPSKRRRWKLLGTLGAGTLLIGAIGAIADPESDTDAAPETTSSSMGVTLDTTPRPTAEAAGTTNRPTTTAAAPTSPPAEQPATTAATAVPVAPAPTTPSTQPAAITPEPTAPALVVAEYTVTKVVDGDTIDVQDGSGVVQRVRLIGIDAPEMDSCGSQPATDALVALAAGRSVTLTMGGDGEDTDGYGRLLRYVDAGGTDVGRSLIEQGLAIARYDSRDGYGRHDREDAYVAADAASPNYTCAAVPAPIAELPPAVQTPPPADVYYENCTAVKAAGAAPIHPGDPGWQSKFDRDNDGIGCES